jgi:hypothetical protein
MLKPSEKTAAANAVAAKAAARATAAFANSEGAEYSIAGEDKGWETIAENYSE